MSQFCWNRARLWHASELVSFLVGLRTYQHHVICLTNVKSTIAWTSPSMTLVRASQRIWVEKFMKCRKAVGNSSKLVLFMATFSTWNKKSCKSSRSKKAVISFLKFTSELRVGYRLLSQCSYIVAKHASCHTESAEVFLLLGCDVVSHPRSTKILTTLPRKPKNSQNESGKNNLHCIYSLYCGAIYTVRILLIVGCTKVSPRPVLTPFVWRH